MALRADWLSALQFYDAALEQELGNSRLHRVLGGLYDALGRHGKAQQIYLAGLDHNANDSRLFDSLDRSLLLSEAIRPAVRSLPGGIDKGRDPTAPVRLIASYEVGPSSAPSNLVRDDLQLADALDLVNPLHHLPVIGTIYRRESGDRLDGMTKVIGGGLFGGPFGLFAAALEHAFEQTTGQEMGEALVEAFVDGPVGAPDAVAALPSGRQPLR